MPKVSTYSPDSSTGKALRNLVINKKVSLSSAQILDLHNTPVTLVAAPGEGKFIKVIDIVPILNAGASPYSGDAGLSLKCGDYQIYNGTVFITDSDDTVYLIKPHDLNGGLLMSVVENTPIIVAADDPITDGNGTVIIDVMYRIVDLA